MILLRKKRKTENALEESTEDYNEGSMKTSASKPDYDSLRSVTKIFIDSVQMSKEVEILLRRTMKL